MSNDIHADLNYFCLDVCQNGGPYGIDNFVIIVFTGGYYKTGTITFEIAIWVVKLHVFAISVCGRCLPRAVTLTPADGTPGSITPVIKMLPNDKRGCRQMYVICNTPSGYTKSNMVMNEETSYPLVGKNVRALITCFKGSWHADLGGSYM
ncbi:unnamed protein product [Strongylus vulgaris]|uniref:Uncharacterized protein n=1 Tax=Strongylus vulgaris TaxID=40348 RepID=A0A3P7LT10_STRVU|nr:unnamed protein product [Strongylus vulgaris]